MTMMERRIQEWGESARGVEIQPVRYEMLNSRVKGRKDL